MAARNVWQAGGDMRLALLAAFSVSACSADPDVAARSSEALESAKEAGSRIDALEARLKSLEDKEVSSALLKISDNRQFSIVRTDLGPLTVSLEKIEPLASGSRIFIQIGNSTSAKITKYKMSGEYGNMTKNEMRPFSYDSTSSIEKGSWKTVAVPVDGLTPAMIEHVYIGNISIEGIRLLL
jgi:hypothetical protein